MITFKGIFDKLGRGANLNISYRKTVLACYLGNVSQAIVIHLTPILFVPLREQFGFSFEQLGFLLFVNFATQIICDIAFSHSVDKYGYRRFLIAAPILTVAGFFIFAFAPSLFENPYTGFLVGTIIFSGAGGLLELILSPLINAIPTDEKSAAMSMLHSLFAWGQLATIVGTTLFLYIFGKSAWPYAVMLWAVVPIANLFMWISAPFPPPIPEGKREGIRKIFTQSFFVVAMIVIALGAASELSIAQWSSTFMEKGMGLPKIYGDVMGPCLFAILFGTGRMLFGIWGGRFDIGKMMLRGAALAFVCALTISFSRVHWLTFAACALSGLAVSLMWPGTLVLAAEKYPLAGTWMFAILAAAGDIGAAAGPWIVGITADVAAAFYSEQQGLRIGMFVGSLFPFGVFFGLLRLLKNKNGKFYGKITKN